MKKNIIKNIRKFFCSSYWLRIIGLPLALASAKSKIKLMDTIMIKIKLIITNKNSYLNTISFKELKEFKKIFFMSNFQNISNQDIIIICV